MKKLAILFMLSAPAIAAQTDSFTCHLQYIPISGALFSQHIELQGERIQSQEVGSKIFSVGNAPEVSVTSDDEVSFDISIDYQFTTKRHGPRRSNIAQRTCVNLKMTNKEGVFHSPCPIDLSNENNGWLLTYGPKEDPLFNPFTLIPAIISTKPKGRLTANKGWPILPTAAVFCLYKPTD